MMMIFTRKSLMPRFKYVCSKPSFLNLFRNPSDRFFVYKQHYHTNLNNTPNNSTASTLLVKSQGRLALLYNIKNNNGTGGEKVLTLTKRICLPITKIDSWERPVVLGPCNGSIFCFWNTGALQEDHSITLWDLATRKLMKHVPTSPIERPPGCHFIEEVGFGFDRKTGDYKVLSFVVTFWSSHFPHLRPAIHQVELYSLKNNSWTEIPSPDFRPIMPYPFYPYSHGVQYWRKWLDKGDSNLFGNLFGLSGLVDDRRILSFDFERERFEMLPIPDFGELSSEIAILDGSPAFIVYDEGASEKLYDIWVMSEGEKSWVKLHSLGPISGVEAPLAFWKNGTGLVLRDAVEKQQLVLYDHETQKVTNLGLPPGVEADFVCWLESAQRLASFKYNPLTINANWLASKECK